MNEKFICGISEDNLFQFLKQNNVERITVKKLTTNPISKRYIFIRIVRKYVSKDNTKSCRFMVEECASEYMDGDIFVGFFDLVLKGAFASPKICSKLFTGDRLAIEGFHIEEPFVVSNDRKINFVLPNLNSDISLPNAPCISLNNAEQEAKLWLVANADQIRKNEDFSIYSKLIDLTPRPFAYCFGVIVHFERYKSNESFILRVLLTDESIGFDNYIQFLIKSSNQSTISSISKKYQIVRFHRITITNFNEGISGFARIGSGGFDYFVWPEEVVDSESKSEAALPISKKQQQCAVFFDEDKQIASRLKSWCRSCIAKCPVFYENLDFTISKFTFGSYETVIVQIITVALLERGALLLRVWDGTKAFCPLSKVELENEADIIFSHVAFLETISKGFSVDVFVYDEHIKTGQELLAGSYVKLKNVHAYSSDGNSTVSLTIHGGGKNFDRGFELVNFSPDLLLAKRLRHRVINGYPSHLLPERFEERFFV